MSCLQTTRVNAADRDLPFHLQKFVDASSMATLLFEADERVIYANRAARIFAAISMTSSYPRSDTTLMMTLR